MFVASLGLKSYLQLLRGLADIKYQLLVSLKDRNVNRNVKMRFKDTSNEIFTGRSSFAQEQPSC